MPCQKPWSSARVSSVLAFLFQTCYIIYTWRLSVILYSPISHSTRVKVARLLVLLFYCCCSFPLQHSSSRLQEQHSSLLPCVVSWACIAATSTTYYYCPVSSSSHYAICCVLVPCIISYQIPSNRCVYSHILSCDYTIRIILYYNSHLKHLKQESRACSRLVNVYQSSDVPIYPFNGNVPLLVHCTAPEDGAPATSSYCTMEFDCCRIQHDTIRQLPVGSVRILYMLKFLYYILDSPLYKTIAAGW